MSTPAERPPPMLGLGAQRIVRPGGDVGPGVVWIDVDRGSIVAIGPPGDRRAARAGADPSSASRLVDLGDRIVTAGYVDVHVHGGAGYQVNGDDADEVEAGLVAMTSFHVRHGTTGLLATTVADSPRRLAAAVVGVARAVRRSRAHGGAVAGRVPLPGGASGQPPSPSGAARVLGTHLEGPFIAGSRAGAHDPRAIRPPDRAELNRLLELGDGTIRLVTIAPELPGAEQLIADCLGAGAAVALGHTEADFDAARRAFDAGATHVTHLFNAMPPLHHRRPGIATAALVDPAVTVELICDLHHVHPATVELVARVAGERLVLVTDATAAAGLPPGRHVLGRQAVDVHGSRVSLASDRSTLAGSVLTMGTAVRNAVASGVPLSGALVSAAAIPSGVVRGARGAGPGDGTAEALGRLDAGTPADIVVLEPTLVPAATLVGGAAAHDPGGLLS